MRTLAILAVLLLVTGCGSRPPGGERDNPVSPAVYQRWRCEQSYYALIEIIEAHFPEWHDFCGATKQDVLKHLGKPNWGTVMQDHERQWAYQGSGRHVPYGDKVILTFNDRDELIEMNWVSE